MALPELGGGPIVPGKPGGCRIYPVDLKVAGEHWTELHRWWCARQREREAIGKPWAPRKTAAPVMRSPNEPLTAGEGPTSASPAAPNRRQALLARFMDLSDD